MKFILKTLAISFLAAVSALPVQFQVVGESGGLLAVRLPVVYSSTSC